MREALGVQNEGVYLGLDLLERTHDRRHLPERKEPWYVRKPELSLEALHLDEREPRELEHHDRGISPLFLRGDVCPSHITHTREVESRAGHDPGGQLFLQAPGLGR